MKLLKCPNCGKAKRSKPEGMCCNSGGNSGYQHLCSNCGVWFVETFDGRTFIDKFLSLMQLQEDIKRSKHRGTLPNR